MNRAWLAFVTSHLPYHLPFVNCCLIAGQNGLYFAGQLLGWQKGKVLASPAGLMGPLPQWSPRPPVGTSNHFLLRSRPGSQEESIPTLSSVPYLILGECLCIRPPAFSGSAGPCQHSSVLSEQLVSSSPALGFPGRKRTLAHSYLSQDSSSLNQTLVI